LRLLLLPVVAATSLIVGCSTPSSSPSSPAATAPAPAQQVPSYVAAAKGCAVVVGGSVGNTFSDPKVAGFWHEVNKQISDLLYDSLVLDKYKVVKLTVSVAQSAENERLVLEALARNRCNRVIQISHTVDEDKSGRYFQFNVLMVHLEPKGTRPPGATGTNVVTVGDFKREYRYPRTPASFDSFHTGTFAETVYAELKKSGSLEPLR